MKIVLAGGSGQVGEALRRDFQARGDAVTVLSRNPEPRTGYRTWQPPRLDAWVDSIDGSDVVINLAGRSVNCRYTEANLEAMLRSRVETTQAIGQAIAQANKPPQVWLQMSTATIYAHTFGQAHDEASGEIGGSEPSVPAYWARSIEIAKAWEAALEQAPTPATRKIALRSSMVMTPDKGGIFDVLLGLVRKGLGGPIAGGRQYISWIHEVDFLAAIRWLIEHDSATGIFNLCAPTPLPQREFMARLRQAAEVPVGLPATAWMAKIGAFFLRTDTELVLKSRRVVPGRLMQAGFVFRYPEWESAAIDLCRQSTAARNGLSPAR